MEIPNRPAGLNAPGKDYCQYSGHVETVPVIVSIKENLFDERGSPPESLEERSDRVIHCLWLLLMHHVTGVVDDDQL